MMAVLELPPLGPGEVYVITPIGERGYGRIVHRGVEAMVVDTFNGGPRRRGHRIVCSTSSVAATHFTTAKSAELPPGRELCRYCWQGR